MKDRLPIADCRLPIAAQSGGTARSAVSIVNRKSKIANGFTLVEVLVVMTLLSLIVLVLMAVFNSTQTAFRAGVTQAGVLESGRAAMDLMAEDLRAMSPSLDTNNGAVNFYAGFPPGYMPLVQPLLASIPAQSRTNAQERIFILRRQNQTWTGVGYVVANSSQGDLDSLYRFTATTNVQSAGDPAAALFNLFLNSATTNMSHLMDGVVELTVRDYDLNGVWLTNGYANLTNLTVKNTWFSSPAWGQVGFAMFSNTLPASVQIEMGVIEDRALQRAESLSASPSAQASYLQQQAGAVHVFRQRVSIPNVDPSAYQ
jgi:prepilin-type N-terminal cleavage/methylation domain-containing protein